MLNIKRGDCQGVTNSQYIIMLITITTYHGCHYTVFAYKTFTVDISNFRLCLSMASRPVTMRAPNVARFLTAHK